MYHIFGLSVKLSSNKWKSLRESLKYVRSGSHLTEKQYNDCCRSVTLLPISYNFAFMELGVL